MKLVRYTGPNDWSALYVDGELETVGDHYLVDERIALLCGVELRDGDEFLLGGNSKAGVAHSLAEIDDFVNEADAKEEAADALRRQAAELLRQAEELSSNLNRQADVIVGKK